MSVSHSWLAATFFVASACGGVQDSQVIAPAEAAAPASNSPTSSAPAATQDLTSPPRSPAEPTASLVANTAEPQTERSAAQAATSPPTTVGETTEPLRVFERFLALAAADQLDSDEGRALLAPGFDSAPKSSDGERPSCNAIVRIDARHAVAHLTHRLKPPEHSKRWKKPPPPLPTRYLDSYWYLEDLDGWRVTEMRALAQMGLVEMAAQFGADLTRYDAEATERVENARLTLKSDAELAQWFTEHRAEIDELVKLVRSVSPDQPLGAVEAEKTKVVVGRLRLSSAAQLANGDVEIVVGGITDNVVSFRLAADSKLPRISGDDVIWAEALGGGWFLVKTT